MNDMTEREMMQAIGRVAAVKVEEAEALEAVKAARGAVVKGNLEGQERRRWKMIVRVSIPSGIAAALALVLGMLWIAHDSQRVDAADELRQIAAVNRNYKGWIHVRTVQEGAASQPEGKAAPTPITSEFEYHINTADGTIGAASQLSGKLMVFFYVPSRREMYRYDGVSGQIQITDLLEEDVTRMEAAVTMMPATLGEWIDLMNKEKTGGPVEMKQELEGNQERWELVFFKDGGALAAARKETGNPALPARITMWVDRETKRVTRDYCPGSGTTLYTYGAPEIREIYDLGVPRETKVIDNRAAMDVKKVMDRLDQRAAKGFGDHVAVLTGAHVGPDGKVMKEDDARHLNVFAIQGTKMLSMSYWVGPVPGAAPKAGMPSVPVVDVPTSWPKPDVKELLEKIKGVAPLQFEIRDGKHGSEGFYDCEGGTYSVVRFETGERRKYLGVCGAYAFEDIWPNQHDDPFMGMRFKLMAAPSAPASATAPRAGLVGILAATNPSAMTMEYQNSELKAAEPSYNEEEFWVDPARDDMPVEKIIKWSKKKGDKGGTVFEFKYLEYGRLANGQWYPTRWRETRDEPGVKENERKTTVLEWNLQIVQGMKLDDIWYKPPSERFPKKEK